MTVAEPLQPAVSGRLLVIEDDASLRRVLCLALERAGHRVDSAEDGLVGAEKLSRGGYEVVLLDIGLPFVDGWRLLDTLEGRRQPSVIVISARGDERDKVRALDMGADDYLTKPFGAGELLARVRAVLRRVRGTAGAARVVRCGDVVVDLGARMVTRAEEEVRLSPTEYVLLAEMARHPGVVLDHRTLLARVWGPMYAGDRNYLRTFVQRLRRKLERDPAEPEVIVTVGRRGYRLGPPAEPPVPFGSLTDR
ncbi:MAG TPA: response regulator transcription factor [Candidatus Binatia bacterium]|nr:response regulator transcription factor [Candidatus Binatia bacterium]